MNKIIVTHFRPDLDAVSSVWLVQKYFPGFSDAQIEFVSAGHTYQGQVADTDQNIIHVDTGKGMFDHHHLPDRLSAAKRIVTYILDKNYIQSSTEKEALLRLAEVVTMIDNFEEAALPNPESDFYDMALHQLLAGFEYAEPDDLKVIEFANNALGAFFTVLKHKVVAEAELKKGTQFEIKGFKGIALETRNEEAMHLAQKIGYDIVIRKDPKTGRGRIKVRPLTPLTLEKVYEELARHEDRNQWFYHASGKMILNGSTRNQTLAPSKLTLLELVNIVKTAVG
jgi:hypothetical protein